jgi:arabinogalactan endo-1,4-beta-galactosidase
VRNTGLGRTEKDIAQYLLNQKIQEMRLAYYAEPRPEDDRSIDGGAKGSPAK